MNLLYTFIVVILSTCYSCSNSSTNAQVKPSTESINYEAQRDSILYENKYGSIYFTRDTSARFYNWFNDDDSKSDLYSTYYTSFLDECAQKNNFKFKKVNSGFTNKLWITAHNFNHELCLYSPSDWFTMSTLKITDSTIFDMRSADPSCYLIESHQKISPTTHLFKTKEAYSFTDFEFQIEILDKQQKISLWKITDRENNFTSEVLKIESSTAKNYPSIVEDCGNQKCSFNQQFSYFSPITVEFIHGLKK